MLSRQRTQSSQRGERRNFSLRPWRSLQLAQGMLGANKLTEKTISRKDAKVAKIGQSLRVYGFRVFLNKILFSACSASPR